MNFLLASNTAGSQAVTDRVRPLSLRANQVVLTGSVVVISLITILQETS